MKKINLVIGVLLILLTASCKKDEKAAEVIPTPTPTAPIVKDLLSGWEGTPARWFMDFRLGNIGTSFKGFWGLTSTFSCECDYTLTGSQTSGTFTRNGCVVVQAGYACNNLNNVNGTYTNSNGELTIITGGVTWLYY